MSEQNLNNEQQLFTSPVGEFEPQELMSDSINTMDVTKKIFAIRRLRKETEKFEQQRKEALEFYNRKIDGIEKQIAFLEENVWKYLAFVNEDKIVTPAGTAFVTNREKWNWTDDADAILNWAKANAPQTVITSTDERPDLAALKKYIKESQIVPSEIVVVTDESKINIRTAP